MQSNPKKRKKQRENKTTKTRLKFHPPRNMWLEEKGQVYAQLSFFSLSFEDLKFAQKKLHVITLLSSTFAPWNKNSMGVFEGECSVMSFVVLSLTSTSLTVYVRISREADKGRRGKGLNEMKNNERRVCECERDIDGEGGRVWGSRREESKRRMREREEHTVIEVNWVKCKLKYLQLDFKRESFKNTRKIF